MQTYAFPLSTYSLVRTENILKITVLSIAIVEIVRVRKARTLDHIITENGLSFESPISEVHFMLGQLI